MPMKPIELSFWEYFIPSRTIFTCYHHDYYQSFLHVDCDRNHHRHLRVEHHHRSFRNGLYWLDDLSRMEYMINIRCIYGISFKNVFKSKGYTKNLLKKRNNSCPKMGFLTKKKPNFLRNVSNLMRTMIIIASMPATVITTSVSVEISSISTISAISSLVLIVAVIIVTIIATSEFIIHVLLRSSTTIEIVHATLLLLLLWLLLLLLLLRSTLVETTPCFSQSFLI